MDNGPDPRSAVRVQILTVGREILTGRTLDTNAHWLCRRIYALGGLVQRLVTVDDRLGAIHEALRWALDQGFGLIITSGGLGPTHDDLTLEGVALATGRPLEEHEEAIGFVAERYRVFHASGAVESPRLTPERRKMALLPRGAEMVPNSVGAAPGVWLQTDTGVVVSLPGVPAELKSIFEEQLAERIRALLGAQHRSERQVPTPLGDESVLAQLVDRVMKRVQGVYIKTLPTTFGPEVRLQVRMEAAGRDPEEVADRLRRAEEALGEEFRRWQNKEG